MSNNREWYFKGLRDGIPIALGYFAVAFTLGIAAKKAGLGAFQAFLASGLTNASAGGYAAFTLIGAGAADIELAITELIVNARYLLMSCALSQKIAPETSLLHRMLMAFDVTDEIFGISVSVTGTLNPFYNYGAMSVAIPGWAFGTLFGVIMRFKRGTLRYVFGNNNTARKKKQNNSGAGYNFNGGKPCLFKDTRLGFCFRRYANNNSHGGNFSACGGAFPCKGRGGKRRCSIIFIYI